MAFARSHCVGRTFPDINEDISVSKKYFQTVKVRGLNFSKLLKSKVRDTDYWTVIYYDTVKHSINSVRSAINLAFPRVDIKYISYEEEETTSYWRISLYKKVVKCWDYVKSKVYFNNNNGKEANTITVSPRDNKGKQIVFKKDYSDYFKREDEYTLHLEDKSIIKLDDYNESLKPRAIYRNNINVTNLLTGKVSLTKRSCLTLKDMLSKGTSDNKIRAYFTRTRWNYRNNKLKEKSEEIDNNNSKTRIDDHKDQNITEVVSQALVEDPPSNKFSKVPYNYDDLRKVYQFSKFADFEIIKKVQRYILHEFGVPGHSPLSYGEVETRVELRTFLLYNGLPLDESLIDLYFEFCKEKLQISDAKGELLELYNQRKRKLIKMK